jgi:uncharacterized protein
MKFYRSLLLILPAIMLLAACATYYQKSQVLMEAVYAGNYKEADKIIDKGKLRKQKRNKLLYYLNKGTILFMDGQPEESNKYFQQADYFIEDFQKNYAAKAATLLVNPTLETYEGESYEKIMVHYYTVLNYLQMNKLDEALVECKRMQIKLTRITDYYKGKNKYKDDAFVHLLTGIVYDAQNDYNNAFIAYRNAYKTYNEVYATELNTPVPAQLKYDLVRTAVLTGFTQEAEDYKKEFGLENYDPRKEPRSSLVTFWNNGYSPVKDQWSINFSVIPAGDGWVNFTNWDLGLNFPFYVGGDTKSLTSLNFIRVAFPKYISRLPVTRSAVISIDSVGVEAKLQVAENLDKIAYVSLKDRMLKEMGEALLRLALKQVAAAQLRKENELAGAALSIAGAISEQADTRNWQTLPNTISYSRIMLNAGTFAGKFKTEKQDMPFTATVRKNATTFKLFQSPYFSGYSDSKGKN